ncbi:unnamed protein product [marine sediment metagenome]|uniref:Uncharacterized protein n=1 Tax=marine sediment metagenome TaxID=412755 RepID=X0XCI4_9ZZZZ
MGDLTELAFSWKKCGVGLSPRVMRERSKTPGMCGTSMRENREIPGLPVPDGGAGRRGKAKAASHG